MVLEKPGESPQKGFERKMYDVSKLNIKCCDCGIEIAQLPFDPDPSRLDRIRCQDCMRKFREQRPRRRF